MRRICTFCKEPFEVPPSSLVAAGFKEREARTLKLFKGRGCEQCGTTGYKGRAGLYEVMHVDDELRELILSGASSIELREKAVENGMITLRGSGLQKIRDGVSSLEEVLRETVL